MPLELTVTAAGGTVVQTHIDHSAGLLRYTSNGCGAGVTGGVTDVSDRSGPTLSRSCQPVASGTVSGTTPKLG
jgi:hypothetical protein